MGARATKAVVGDIVRAAGGEFVGAVATDTVPRLVEAAPIFACGPDAARWRAALSALGLQVTAVGQVTSDRAMSRITITLSELRYRALKEASAQRRKTIGQLIDESLEFYGIRSHDETRDLIRRAREHSGLSEAAALDLAVAEVRAARRGE